MTAERFLNGFLIIPEAHTALPEDTRTALLDKWEAANDDGEVEELLDAAARIAEPMGFVVPAHLDELAEDHVVLDGIRFDSTLIPEQLRPLADTEKTVCAYTITCGRALHDWYQSQSDVLLKGVAEDIAVKYLYQAAAAMRAYVSGNYFRDKHFSAMNPGSLNTWDIRGQVPLFTLLGEGAVRCGVELNDSMLMIPFKSGSGIYFASKHSFESCMFCDRLNCPNRRAERVS